MSRRNILNKLKSLSIVTGAAAAVYAGISVYNGDEKFYSNILMPTIHLFDPETAHELAITGAKYRLLPRSRFKDPEILNVTAFGKTLQNPIGIAAGFDKQGEAIKGLDDMGFGFVEIGTVTPLPQTGNDKPRVFRIPENLAVINRYGFNSDGHTEVLERLTALRNDDRYVGAIGVNLGKNKISDDPVDDFAAGVKKFSGVADYLVINISSPNTPGLRGMQSKENLEILLRQINAVRNPNRKPPLFLKLSPDLTEKERLDISRVLKIRECQVDGLIISNTTTKRPDALVDINQDGGLSGKPLQDPSTDLISDMFRLTNGMFIIGVGGVFSGQDAYEKILAGASLVQIYTSLIYNGPPVVTTIKRDLQHILTKNGYSSVSEAVGAGVKK